MENETHKLLWNFVIQTDHPNLGQMTRPSNNQRKKKKKRKKRDLADVNFAVAANHCIKVKESEKKDKYQDLARELK